MPNPKNIMMFFKSVDLIFIESNAKHVKNKTKMFIKPTANFLYMSTKVTSVKKKIV